MDNHRGTDGAVMDLKSLKTEISALRTRARKLSRAVRRPDFWCKASRVIEGLALESRRLRSARGHLGLL